MRRTSPTSSLKEQTDFKIPEQTDTRRYLRQTDVEGEGAGPDVPVGAGQGWKLPTGWADAPEGRTRLLKAPDVKLADGKTVTPVYAIFRKKLDAEQ